MSKFVSISLLFFLAACQTSEPFIDPVRPDLENLSFDVVQKQIVIEPQLPNHVSLLVSQWFDKKVKIDGFDGEMKFTIYEYLEEISSINEGKRIDISMSFNLILDKPSLSKTQMIEGNVITYGTLTGNFSIAEFETLIENTQSDLVLRLSRDLKSKI